MALISSQKSAPVLLAVLAGLVGYMAYTGAVISTLGVKGLPARKEEVAAIRDTIATLWTPHRQRQAGAGHAVPSRTCGSGSRRIAAASRCCAGWCRSGTRCPTCSTTSPPGARSAA